MPADRVDRVQNRGTRGWEPGRLVRRACNWWHECPLLGRTLAAVAAGALIGTLLGSRAAALQQPAALCLRLLHAAAPILVLLALTTMLADSEVRGRTWFRLAGLLSLNTAVAALIGLLAGNFLCLSGWAAPAPGHPPSARNPYSWSDFFHHLPTNLAGPVAHHDVLTYLVLAIALGFALRKVKRERRMPGEAPYQLLASLGTVINITLAVLLDWILDLLPLVLLGITAGAVGKGGLRVFLTAGPLVLTALAALLLQAGYYLARVRLETRVRPWDLLRGGAPALLAAFSSASSTTAQPVADTCLREHLRLDPEAAGMGTLIGANVSKDGTILYLALVTLFTAQMHGFTLGVRSQVQLVLVLASLIARITPGVPGAGFATMAVACTAVGLPLDSLPVLLSIDWLMDRCRTTINVLGFLAVSCLLQGKRRPDQEGSPPSAPEPALESKESRDEETPPDLDRHRPRRGG